MEEAVLEAGNVDVVIARLFHLVGPGQPNAFAVASWAQQSREFPGPVTVGSLDLERDYLDVRDGAAALVTLAQRGATKQAYNVCRGEGVSLRWMFEQVTGGREAQVDPERQRTDDPPSIVGDPRKLKALTWTPEVSLVDSLAEMSQYLDA